MTIGHGVLQEVLETERGLAARLASFARESQDRVVIVLRRRVAITDYRESPDGISFVAKLILIFTPPPGGDARMVIS